jgi:MFS family permease
MRRDEMSETEQKKVEYPKPTYAWGLVALLTIAYVSSFIDRYILGLLIDPIKETTGASDTQMGFLSSAFTFCYALIALPLGFLVDRKSRTKIVAIGIFLWSAATVWSGLAKNFVQLFAARMAVGVGEAVLSPSAFSMIGDSFPKEKRGLPIAVYSMALVIGASVANLISSGVLTWARSVGQISMPVFGEIETWQFIFIIVGLPGFLLALIFFFLRDPPRVESSPREGAKLTDAVVFIWEKAPTFFTFVSVFTCMVAVAYGGFFNAPLFDRTWGWDPAKYALWNGLSILAVSPLTFIIFGKLSDRWVGMGIKDAPLKIAVAGLFVMIPPAVIGPLLPNAYAAFFVLLLSNVGIGMISVTGVNALLNIVPGDIRGFVVAVYYMCISLIGGSVSPPLIGWLNDAFFAGEGLRYAMAIYPAVFGVPVILLSPLTLRFYKKELMRAEQQNA